jgi:hypothetical protein
MTLVATNIEHTRPPACQSFEVNIFDSLGVLRSALEAAQDAVIRFSKVA